MAHDLQRGQHPADHIDINQAIASPAFRADPYPLYANMRTTHPVYRAHLGAWLVSRRADVARILHEHQNFSSDSKRADAARQVSPGPLDRALGLAMMASDPPDHTRMRTLTSLAFRERRHAIHAQVDATALTLLDNIADARAMDLIEDFADRLPFTIICDLLGISPKHRPQLREWVRALSDGASNLRALGHLDPMALRHLDIAAEALYDFMAGMVHVRGKRPANDLITDLLRLRMDDRWMTDTELTGTCIMLLLAGHDTVANLIGNGILALLRNPHQWDCLTRTPDLANSAVEELLRYDSPTQMVGRTVVQDIHFAESVFHGGDFILALTGAANRDPEHFPNPDALEITRTARSHLSFGVAPHICLGGPLARLEARTAFRALALRLPNLKLAIDTASWKPWPPVATDLGLSFGLRALKELPLSW